MRTLEVAIVGSGPAGLYAAEALIKQAAVLEPPQPIRVDVLDRLPTPYGLVRYGVAPDHKSIKSIADYLRRVLEHEGVRFLGGVHLGEDVTRDDLLASYDAVVYATGAMRDRRLGIPGEDLPGSYAATDFVNWYCGHPDVDPAAFSLDAESVAVIGVGNVAVDVARILIRDPAELRETDISQPVLEALEASKVREVHVIGRRGPAQAKFTTKELRELGELEGVDVVVGAGEHDLDAFDPTGESARLAQTDRHVRGNYAVISGWASRAPAGHPRRLTVRFWLRPTEIQGAERVSGLILERTRLDDSGVFAGTGQQETLDVQMVLRSVGYQSVPLLGLPFDQGSYTVPNEEGRVLGPDGQPLPGEYVAGWLKRGPTGVIGTNKSDAAQTVRALLADLAGGPGPGDVPLPRAGLLRMPAPAPAPAPAATAAATDKPAVVIEPGAAGGQSAAGGAGQASAAAEAGLTAEEVAAEAAEVAAMEAAEAGAAEATDLAVLSRFEQLLEARGIRPVSYADWLRIEAAEEELAVSLGRGARVKLPSREHLHRAYGPGS
ncbi:MAG TPA: NADP oxidoreductase [Actinobacteria bacterium]|jgi:ferredoxin--NADP+ reductase|nr:NADP oxidoreductase [Actinomycetota bacterium]